MAKNTVNIAIKVDGAQAKKLVNSLKKDFDGLDDTTDNTSKGFKNLGGVIAAGVAAVGIREIAGLTKKVFELGSTVEETESKFNTSLGNQADAGREFLEEYSTLLGLTNTEAQNFLATQVNIANGLGFAAEESFDLSKEVVKLAGDLASFNNIPIERTLNAIQGGLTGEREALKSLGIVVRQQDVDQRALLNTGKERVSQLTEQEKALASFQIITERSGAAVGDLERTQDSAANRARQLQANIGDLANDLSVLLLPALAKGIEFTLEFVENLSFLLDPLSDVKSEIALTGSEVNSTITEFESLRKEIAEHATQNELTAEQERNLRVSYGRTTDKLLEKAEALQVERQALLYERDEQEKGSQAYIEAQLQIDALTGFINIYSEAINRGTLSFEEYLATLAEVNQEQAKFQGGLEVSTEKVEGLTSVQTTNAKSTNLQKVAYQGLPPIVKDVETGVTDLSGAFVSGADAARNGIQGLIKSLINQAIATQVTKALATIPFPFNLAAAGAAGFAVNALMSKLIPGFADGVTGFGGGTALVGERGPELVTLPQGSNVVTNENTESIVSALSRQSTTQGVAEIGSQAPDMVGAIKEAFKDIEIPIKGEISNDVIRLANKRSLDSLKRNTVTI